VLSASDTWFQHPLFAHSLRTTSRLKIPSQVYSKCVATAISSICRRSVHLERGEQRKRVARATKRASPSWLRVDSPNSSKIFKILLKTGLNIRTESTV